MIDKIPTDVDVLILGAGAGGMSAALTASILGLDVVLVEKTDQVGGTSALSAGSVWAPNSRHCPPGSDSIETALAYLRNAVGNKLDDAKAMAFLRAAPEMVDFLEKNTAVGFRPYAHHPDYLASLDGATLSGRALEPMPFDASVLGERFADIRPPPPEFMLFAGMMVDRTDIRHLMNARRKLSSLGHALRLFIRYGLDRLRHRRGTRLVMGNALIGRLYHALLQRNVPVMLSTGVERIVHKRKRVTGAIVSQAGSEIEISAKGGVILATGGLAHHPELRSSLMPGALDRYSLVVESATGDGLTLAGTIGGHLAPEHDSNGFWAPMSRRLRPDGSMAVFPHFLLDRGKPGILAVDPAGRRFVNEATTYQLFGEALAATLNDFERDTCFLVCDHAFIRKYGLGMVRPMGIGLRSAIAEGYLTTAKTLPELAERLQIPADALTAAVTRFNGFADTGVDEDFGKGGDAYQRNMGDPTHRPNPCIGEIGKSPFYAVEIRLGDIGSSAGLACDASARVLDGNGNPIEALYACGNDMASIMAGRYPGPGINLGPAMTFGYIAARHAFAALRKVKP